MFLGLTVLAIGGSESFLGDEIGRTESTQDDREGSRVVLNEMNCSAARWFVHASLANLHTVRRLAGSHRPTLDMVVRIIDYITANGEYL